MLRFFEEKPLKEVGGALGTSEDAAKMRVTRALDKMRDFFNRKRHHRVGGCAGQNYFREFNSGCANRTCRDRGVPGGPKHRLLLA